MGLCEEGSDCIGMVSETFNETTANSVTPWAEQTVYGSFRMWQILLLGGGICLSLVVLLCCCVRIRIPRTKQEIEADFRRKQLAKRFREELKRIRNSELDIMDLKNALDRLRVDFKSDSESLNPSDSMFQNAVSGDGRSGPISNSNMGTQQWLELTMSNLRSTENC